MALRLWLPLNGNTKNIGISNVSMTGSPASWGNGKIGKCATWTGSTTSVIHYDGTVFNFTDNFSWCAWINTNYTGSTAQYAFTSGRADAGGYGFGLQCASASVCKIRFGSAIYDVTVTGGEWTHLAFVKKGTNINIFKNGAIVSDVTFSGTLPTYSDGNGLGLGCFHYASGDIYPFYGSLCDFRIYDHCLSAKEVKEISQGLICHYKLDGFNGGVRENLALGTNTANTSTNTLFYNEQTGGSTRTIEYDNGIPVIVITRNSTIHSGWQYFSYNNINSGEIKTSTVYTISFDVKASVNGSIGLSAFMQGNATNSKSESARAIQGNFYADKWSHIVLQTTTKSDFTGIASTGQVIYMSCGALAATGTVLKMKNMKMEIGEDDTAWCPAKGEAGYSDSALIDSSGFGNNATKTGSFVEDNSSRYSCSLRSPNGTDFFTSGISFSDIKTFTCSFWVKPNVSSGRYCIIASNNASPNSGFWIAINCENRSVWFYDGSYCSVSGSLTNDSWYHCVLVSDNKTMSWYINGVKQTLAQDTAKDKTINISNLSLFNSYSGSSWNTINYGSISDFRFYTTALSADDILDLYKVSESIDNLGSSHVFSVSEDKTSIGPTKEGILNNQEINEYHVEPDGSVWEHIFHHDTPSSYLFSSTDDFTNGFYTDCHRWSNLQRIKAYSSYEFLLCEENPESRNQILKYRWSQTISPLIAAWADVQPGSSNVTLNTSTGYSTGTGSAGGMYIAPSNNYLNIANSASGNWYGAIGCWTEYNGGVPGYPNRTVKNGIKDLYIRVTDSKQIARLQKNGLILTNTFIEK